MELLLTSSPSPFRDHRARAFRSAARPRAFRRSSRAFSSSPPQNVKISRMCCPAHTGAWPPTSYKSSMAARKDGVAIRLWVHGGLSGQERRERRARRRDRRVAIFFAHRLRRAGRRRAGRRRPAPARPLCDVLDRRRPHSDRRRARGRARVSRTLHAAFSRPRVSRPLCRTGLGGAFDIVDPLSGRGGAIDAETERALGGDAAGGGGAARKRERDRSLPVPDRRRRRHGDNGRASAFRDPCPGAGRRQARGRRGRDRRPPVPGDRRNSRRADATALRGSC